MTIKEYIEKEGIVKFEKKLTIKGKEKVKFPNWIITDTRFPNEIKAVKNKDGICIRIFRTNSELQNKPEHESETALDSYNDWDYIIDNNGSIDELINSVRRILQAEFPYAQFNNNLKE